MSSSSDVKPENYAVNAKICQLVAQCPFMYDRSHAQYLKKDVCDFAWIKIAKEMGESVSTCRERWRNIRTSFARSINTNKIACRANRTKPYYLHEELKFLLHYITPGVPVTRRYKKNKSSAAESGGEESELIEVSVGEDTFNGFEHLSCSYGDFGGDITQNGHEISWQQQHQQPSNGGGGGEIESCDSSLNDEQHGNKRNIEQETASSRLARLPPPPLQAAPLSAFQHGADETEAAAALQQIHMSSATKRARLETTASTAASDVSAINFLAEQQRRISRSDILGRAGTNAGGINGSGGSADSCGALHVDDFKHTAYVPMDGNSDFGFLHELQMELRNMDRRQKMHFKRRVYEALTEIYPMTTPMAATLTTSPTTDTLVDTLNTTADLARQVPSSHVATQVNRQDLGVIQQKKSRRDVSLSNGTSETTNDSTAAVPTPPTVTPKQLRHNISTRSTHNECTVATTRSATAERRRPQHNTQSQQSTQSVKDEPGTENF